MPAPTGPASLEALLHVVTDKGNVPARQALSRVSAEARAAFYDAYISNLNALSISREDLEGEISLVLALRMLWRLVPDRIFSGIDPDYEQIAHRAYEAEFEHEPSPQFTRMLGTVYRRLRSTRLAGRPDTRLDLMRPLHREILARQGGACALCKYVFPERGTFYLDEEDISYYEEAYRAKDGELVLERYYRRPVLDHIVPHFLGGDGPENWQILCHTCNSGKGEALAWVNRKGWLPPARISDTMALSSAMRFACLSNYGSRFAVAGPDHRRVLRIFKVDQDKLILMDNLTVDYC